MIHIYSKLLHPLLHLATSLSGTLINKNCMNKKIYNKNTIFQKLYFAALFEHKIIYVVNFL